MPATATGTVSTMEMCERAGCTYRQADWWASNGVLVGQVQARGSGSRRRYSEADVTVATALTALAGLGAQVEVLRRAAPSLRAAVDGGLTGERLYVSADGEVTFEAPASGWTIRL